MAVTSSIGGESLMLTLQDPLETGTADNVSPDKSEGSRGRAAVRSLIVAPRAGLEPATIRLTAERSTN
jgi:hypothetical protein